MALVCHLVTFSNDPAQGGVQETVHRLAARLAALDDVRIVIYTFVAAASGGEGVAYEVQDLSAERARLAAPLLTGTHGPAPLRLKRLSPEGFQINRLLLRARLESALCAAPKDRHVVASFFLTTLGFTVELVARELGLAHVAFLAGSDLNRDAASPAGFAAAAFVIAGAEWIVASNRDQVVRLDRLFGRRERVSVSHGALPPGRPRGYWTRAENRDVVALVSDCGYSFKKATHVLVEVFGRHRSAGLPVTLTVVGRTDRGERDYWADARRVWQSRFPGVTDFRDYVSKDDLEAVLLAGDVYCSASLGEGSPNGAIYALALGMPVVAPRSSSLADLADEAVQRVALPRGGDLEDFSAQLVEVVEAVRRGPSLTARTRLDALRRRFWDSEARDWLDVLDRAARLPVGA